MLSGCELGADARSATCATPYVNLRNAEGHSHPTIPLVSDDEWLRQHAFYVTANGDLSQRHRHCEPALMVEA